MKGKFLNKTHEDLYNDYAPKKIDPITGVLIMLCVFGIGYIIGLMFGVF